MKPLSNIAVASLIAAGAASPAHAARTLYCTSTAGERLALMIADGSVQLWEKDHWSANWCGPGDRCGWSGSTYTANAEYFTLYYDSASRAFDMDEMMSGRTRGTCSTG